MESTPNASAKDPNPFEFVRANARIPQAVVDDAVARRPRRPPPQEKK